MPNPSLPSLLASLDAAAERATGGQWDWTEPPDSVGDGEFLWSPSLDEGVLNHAGTEWNVSPENRRHIALCSPDNIRRVVAAYRELHAENERLRAGLITADYWLVMHRPADAATAITAALAPPAAKP